MIIIDNTAANTFGLTKLTTNIKIFPIMNKWYILVNKFCIYNLKITYLFWVIGLYQLAICLAAPIMHAVEVFLNANVKERIKARGGVEGCF